MRRARRGGSRSRPEQAEGTGAAHRLIRRGAPGDSSRNRRVEVAGECGYPGHLDPLAIWAPKNLRLISCDLVSSPLSLGLLTSKRRTKMPAPRRVGESFPGVVISPRAFPFSSNLSSLL